MTDRLQPHLDSVKSAIEAAKEATGKELTDLDTDILSSIDSLNAARDLLSNLKDSDSSNDGELAGLKEEELQTLIDGLGLEDADKALLIEELHLKADFVNADTDDDILDAEDFIDPATTTPEATSEALEAQAAALKARLDTAMASMADINLPPRVKELEAAINERFEAGQISAESLAEIEQRMVSLELLEVKLTALKEVFATDLVNKIMNHSKTETLLNTDGPAVFEKFVKDLETAAEGKTGDDLAAAIDNFLNELPAPTEEVKATPEADPDTVKPYEPSAEMAAKSKELISFLDSFGPTFEKLLSLPEAAAVAKHFRMGPDAATKTLEAYKNGLENQQDIVRHTMAIEMISFTQTNQDMFKKIAEGEASDDEKKALGERTTSFVSALTPKLKALAEEHGIAAPDLGNSTKEQKPLPENATATDIEDFLESTPEHLRLAFSRKHKLWKAAVKEGTEKRPFAVYLKALAASDPEGFGKTYENGMVLAGFYQAILPFIEMLRELGFLKSKEEEKDPDETPEEKEERVRVEKAGKDAHDLEIAFKDSGVNIADMFDENGKFNKADTESFLLKNDLTIDDVKNFVASFPSKVGKNPDAAKALLNKGWSYKTLNDLAALPATVTVTDKNITIQNGTDTPQVIDFKTNGTTEDDLVTIMTAVNNDVKKRNDALAEGEITEDGLDISVEGVLTEALIQEFQAFADKHPKASRLFKVGLPIETLQTFMALANTEKVMDEYYMEIEDAGITIDHSSKEYEHYWTYRQLEVSESARDKITKELNKLKEAFNIDPEGIPVSEEPVDATAEAEALAGFKEGDLFKNLQEGLADGEEFTDADIKLLMESQDKLSVVKTGAVTFGAMGSHTVDSEGSGFYITKRLYPTFFSTKDKLITWLNEN